MFFWGGYSFQAPQQAEHPERPPLKYPMYVPPPASMISSQCVEPLCVKHVACGLKHVVVVVSDPISMKAQEEAEAEGPSPSSPITRHRVFGLGSNHSGQLGRHVPQYTNTLTDLQLHAVMDGPVVSVACGLRHTLVCTSSGCVYAAGDNSCGQVGITAHNIVKMNAGVNSGSPYVESFTQLSSLVHIKQVYASHNASFALDTRGQLYAWGDAQYGHLGLNDKGERMDPKTLKIVTENVASPTLVGWFHRHRVHIIEVAVGKAHLVCRSEDEVYTCGEGYFGKLGHGDVLPQLEPTRVNFPPRKQTERLICIAAGDSHTLVLKENPVIGSVVYFFGRLSNGDGQLQPVIVPVPSAAPLRTLRAGRGNQCMAINTEGVLYVWGKHSYPAVSNGTNASAPRAAPHAVEVLRPFHISDVEVGGTFVVAVADTTKAPRSQEGETAEEDAVKAEAIEMPDDDPLAHALRTAPRCWDVVVPHDARVTARNEGDDDEVYEQGVRAFLSQYYGSRLSSAYASHLPVAPARTAAATYQFKHVGAHGLTASQKVRLWMTNLYALGTVVAVHSGTGIKEEDTSTAAIQDSTNETAASPGQRVTIEWQRDDWKDEVLTLYSQDETVDAENLNRWQPFWFEQSDAGEYVVAKSR